MRYLVLAFGLIGCAVVTAATARYGYLTSDNVVDGTIAAILFSFVAIAGFTGHAVAVRVWGVSRLWSVIIGLVSVAAMLVSLTNSLGFVALRGKEGAQQAAQANSVIADARANIARLQAQRDALPKFQPATAEQVAFAKSALEAATGARTAECAKLAGGRGGNCRDREADERTASARLIELEGSLAATTTAAGLDGQIAEAQRALAAAGSERIENPHGRALAALFMMPASEAMKASTLQQFALALLLELAIVLSFVAYELTAQPKTVAAPAGAAPLPVSDAPVRTPIAARAPPRLIAKTDRPTGSVSRFFRDRITKADGERTSVADALIAYRAWCEGEGLKAATASDFAEAVNNICDRTGLRTTAKGQAVYLLGARLEKTQIEANIRSGDGS